MNVTCVIVWYVAEPVHCIVQNMASKGRKQYNRCKALAKNRLVFYKHGGAYQCSVVKSKISIVE